MHGLSRRDGTPWTQNGLFPDDIPQVNRLGLAYLGTMSAVGLLGMPQTGAQQAAHVILGQPPSTTSLTLWYIYAHQHFSRIPSERHGRRRIPYENACCPEGQS